jgi:hypothetical protein
LLLLLLPLLLLQLLLLLLLPLLLCCCSQFPPAPPPSHHTSLSRPSKHDATLVGKTCTQHTPYLQYTIHTPATAAALAAVQKLRNIIARVVKMILPKEMTKESTFQMLLALLPPPTTTHTL